MCLYSTNIMSQRTKDSIIPHIMLYSGTEVKPKFNKTQQVLNVEIQNNNDDIEVLVMADGIIIEREISIFEAETLRMDLSNHCYRNYDIYVRTRNNEIQYLGTVEKK